MGLRVLRRRNCREGGEETGLRRQEVERGRLREKERVGRRRLQVGKRGRALTGGMEEVGHREMLLMLLLLLEELSLLSLLDLLQLSSTQ